MTRPVDTADEHALVEAARSNPTRFLDLYDRHFHRIYAYVARRVRDRAEAEDVTAEVFHRALAGLPKFEWRGVPFSAWLFRIASHELADRRRAASRISEADPPESASNAELERQIALFELVGQLADDQRRVIELRFGEGRSIQETAAAIGKTEGAVKQLQRRALANLRDAIGGTHG
jgi:RNA polymerase sigma-70 factor (ECF subfamily)